MNAEDDARILPVHLIRQKRKVKKNFTSIKNWARFIQKIYEVDPLTCPKCQNQMKIISVEEIVKKILKHLGLWNRKARPPPKGKTVSESIIDYSESQLPLSDDYLYYDEEYPEALSS